MGRPRHLRGDLPAGGWPTARGGAALLVGPRSASSYLAARNAGARVPNGLLARRLADSSSPPRGSGCARSCWRCRYSPRLLWVTVGRWPHPGRLWLAPVFAAMAANLHGSFTLFPLIVGLGAGWRIVESDGSPSAARTLLDRGGDGRGDASEPVRDRRVDATRSTCRRNPVIRDDDHANGRPPPSRPRPACSRSVPHWPSSCISFGTSTRPTPVDGTAHARPVLPARARRRSARSCGGLWSRPSCSLGCLTRGSGGREATREKREASSRSPLSRSSASRRRRRVRSLRGGEAPPTTGSLDAAPRD